MTYQFDVIQTDAFKTILRTMKDEISFLEVIPDVDEKELLIWGMNPSLTSLVRFRMKHLESFHPGDSFFLNVDLVSSITRCDQNVGMNWELTDDTMILTMGTMVFEIPLVDIQQERLDIPEVDYNITFGLDASKSFVKAIKSAVNIKAENILFQEGMTLVMKGDNGLKVSTKCAVDADKMVGSLMVHTKLLHSYLMTNTPFLMSILPDRPLGIKQQEAKWCFEVFLAPMTMED